MVNPVGARIVSQDIIILFDCSTITHMGYLILRLGSRYGQMAHRSTYMIEFEFMSGDSTLAPESHSHTEAPARKTSRDSDQVF